MARQYPELTASVLARLTGLTFRLGASGYSGASHEAPKLHQWALARQLWRLTMTNTVEKLSPAELKAELEAIWNRPGLYNQKSSKAGINVWSMNLRGLPVADQAKCSDYLSTEQKARRKGLAMYNKALRASVMAEAVQTVRDDGLIFYDFRQAPKKAVAETVEPAEKPARKRRVSKAANDASDKLIAAMNIFWRVPRSDLAAFLVRFGIAAEKAAQMATLPTLDAVAREFLQVAA